MATRTDLRIPYGIADFKRIRNEKVKVMDRLAQAGVSRRGFVGGFATAFVRPQIAETVAKLAPTFDPKRPFFFFQHDRLRDRLDPPVSAERRRLHCHRGGRVKHLLACGFALVSACAAAACATDGFSRVSAATATERDDLVRRIDRSALRLEADRYSPGQVFQNDVGNGSWPGDTEGRTILALVLQEAALGRKPKHLDEIMRRLPGHLNEKGYMGRIHADFIDEQQLSGNGWLLRALCAYARFEKNPVIDVRPIVRTLARNLFLPGRGSYARYPIDPANRAGGGGASGTAETRTVDGWRLSTDVGCVFIGLDGLVDACNLTGDAELKPVIEEMIARFLEVDLVAIRAQTHATLTALRALLRYDATRYLSEVEKRFDLYVRYGMTDRYENYNWFCRCDTWTEPCAIVDSVLLAHQLRGLTGRGTYATYEARFLSALLAHQCENGGFKLMKTFPKGANRPPEVAADEAYWCCTMRGGAGLAAIWLWRNSK